MTASCEPGMNSIWRVSKYGFHYPWLFGGAYAMNVASTLSALAIPQH